MSSSLQTLSRSILRRSSGVFLIYGLLGSGFTFGQDEVRVVGTSIERRTNDPLDRSEIEFIDGSHWELDSEEMERAEALREGFRQYISDRQISPLEVLGIHARTDSERNRYARRWAKLMIEDAERVLAFQRSYDAAVRDFLGEQPLVELTQLPPRASPLPTLAPKDRLAVFVRLDCTVCNQVVQRVFRAGRHIEGVDVYVLEVSERKEAALHEWANRQGIPPIAVRAKRITLNFDDGLLARVHPRADELPVVMRRRGDEFEPFDPWELP